MTTTREQWRSGAQRVLQVTIFMAIAAVVGFIATALLTKAAAGDIVAAFGTEFLGGHADDSNMSLMLTVTAIFMVVMIALQMVYATRIGAFATLQLDADDGQRLKRVRNGAYVLAAALIVLLLLPLLAKQAATGVIAILTIWILAIVGTAMMRSGYNLLRFSDTLNDTGKQGAENLRYASVCQLRLLFMPLVFMLFTALMTLLFAGSLKSHWDGGEVYVTNLDELGRSLDDVGNRADATMSSMRTLYYIYTIGMNVLLFITILWTIFTLVKPIMGWNRIMNGLAQQEGETADDTAGKDNTVAAKLQKVRPWMWAVLAALLIVLPMLLGSSGKSKATDIITDDEEYGRYENKQQPDNDESAALPKSSFPAGEVTDFVFSDEMNDDYEYYLYAIKGGKKVNTGITAVNMHAITDKNDYDGDGNKEALIIQSSGPSDLGETFIVYYSKALGAFGMIGYFKSDMEAEQTDGIWTFTESSTMEKTRYGYALHHLIPIEHHALDPGETKRRYTQESIFGYGDLDVDITKSYPIDLNDDGTAEMVNFRMGYDRWNQSMYSESFTSNGHTYELVTQGTFIVLENKTQGWHDIMSESITYGIKTLYRWNGNGYEEVLP